MTVVIRTFCVLFVLSIFGMMSSEASAKDSVSAALAKEKGCMSCHEGIEQFTDGAMMDSIVALGEDHGDPGGCVVCPRR